MEIRFFISELESLGLIPMDDCGIILTDNDVNTLLKGYNFNNILFDDWEYDEDNLQLIIYINNSL